MNSIILKKKISYVGILRYLLLTLFGYGLLNISIAHSRSLNTIDGTITILDFDGNEMTDHSNVVIFIDGITANPTTHSQQIIPKISHQGRKFSPHVLPIGKGDTVDFFNDDRIFHNVFSLSKAKTFDLGIYPHGASKLVTFKQSGLVKLYCNIHPKMVGNILVLNNKWFAKSAEDGYFSIKNIPDGEFTLRLWYEFSKGFSQPISFYGGKNISKNLTLRVTKKPRSHKNKFGKPYRKKY